MLMSAKPGGRQITDRPNLFKFQGFSVISAVFFSRNFSPEDDI
jgi:hypothetical protein